MNIIDTLIRLRDDLKEWVTNNILELKESIPSIEGLATEEYVNQEIDKIDKIDKIDGTIQLTDYAKKSEIPTKTSQLTNDSGFLNQIPAEYITETELNAKGYLTEHQDISNKVDKVSGKGLSTNDYTTSEKNKLAGIAAGANKVIVYKAKECTTFTSDDGTCTPLAVQKAVGLFPPKAHEHSQYLTEHQDISGKADKTELNSLTLGVHTDGMIYLFKNGQPIGNGVTQSTQSGDVVGYVDSENNIVLSGKLADGTYKLKYEMEDGSKINVGQIDLSDKPAYTNQIPLSIASDGTPFNGGQGWKTGYRISLSSGNESVAEGYECTGFIPVPGTNCIVRLKNVGEYSTHGGDQGYYGIVGYDENFTKLSANGTQLSTMIESSEDGIITLHKLGWATHFANNSLKYIRICSYLIDETSILTINEKIE